jgi:hypothetical protein
MATEFRFDGRRVEFIQARPAHLQALLHCTVSVDRLRVTDHRV